MTSSLIRLPNIDTVMKRAPVVLKAKKSLRKEVVDNLKSQIELTQTGMCVAFEDYCHPPGQVKGLDHISRIHPSHLTCSPCVSGTDHKVLRIQRSVSVGLSCFLFLVRPHCALLRPHVLTDILFSSLDSRLSIWAEGVLLAHCFVHYPDLLKFPGGLLESKLEGV